MYRGSDSPIKLIFGVQYTFFIADVPAEPTFDVVCIEADAAAGMAADLCSGIVFPILVISFTTCAYTHRFPGLSESCRTPQTPWDTAPFLLSYISLLLVL